MHVREKCQTTASQRKATVLIIVAVIVMLLSLAAYKFLLTMETEHMAAALAGDRLQAKHAAYSARDLMALVLEKSRQQRDALGGMTDNPILFGGQSNLIEYGSGMTGISNMPNAADGVDSPSPLGRVAYAIDKPPAGDRQLRVQSQAVESMSRDMDDDVLGGVPTRFGAKNESGKLHLLRVLQWEVEEPGLGKQALLSLPGMSPQIADAILDWLDPDDVPRDQGAESTFYRSFSRPISPRNGLPPDLDELLFIKGISAHFLFGDPPPASRGLANTSDALTERLATSIVDESDDASRRPWVEYLTVYSAERNESYGGEPRVFLNSRDLMELHAELLEIMPKAWADFVIFYRQFGPSEQPVAISSVSVSDDLQIDFSADAEFLIQNPLDLLGVTVTVTIDEQESSLTSPWGMDETALPPQLSDVLDRVTLEPGKRIVGRVNVNVAPAEVLAAIPNMPESAVEGIVSARESETMWQRETTLRQHPVWLLQEGLLDLEAMRLVMPHITCGGDVYRAEVWGFVDERQPVVRFETVLDASTGKSQSVFFRERSAPIDEIQLVPSENAIMRAHERLPDDANAFSNESAFDVE